MLWRFLRLNWRYAISELVIVVAGVLIAFAVDRWNDDRLDRADEAQIIDRMIGDLNADLETISVGEKTVAFKLGRLREIQSNLTEPDDRPADAATFLSDIAESAVLGWSQVGARRITYDEIIASGKFSLIRSTPIRVAIGDYYENDTVTRDRVEERETGYAELTYRLVPRLSEFELAKDLSKAEAERLVNEVYASDLRSLLTAEVNFSLFLAELLPEWRDRCVSLIRELTTYRDSGP